MNQPAMKMPQGLSNPGPDPVVRTGSVSTSPVVAPVTPNMKDTTANFIKLV